MDRRLFLRVLGCGCLSFRLTSCETVAITDRKQLNFIPEKKLNAKACIIYIYTLMPNEKEDFPEYTKDSKTLPLIEKLSVMLTDNFEFFNETQMQDIINSDNNNESIENE